MIQVKDLSFRYGDTPILKDISFCANEGEITAVIGANGVGKSTMLKCIAGLQKSSGQIILNGKDRLQMKEQEIPAKLGYLCQNIGCSSQLSVFEVILTGLVNELSFHVSEENIARVQHIMDIMDLTKFSDRRISQLSGGQQQLVFIAQTLVKDPQILIMDEPTSALDLEHQFQLMDLIENLTHEKKFTTLLTLHHLDLVAKYADRVIVLKDGSIYCDGSPETTFTDRMFQDVYGVHVEFYRDQHGIRHMVPVNRIEY